MRLLTISHKTNSLDRSKAAAGSSNSSSSEDFDSLLGANRAFSGVVIDPVPAGIRKSGNFDDLEVANNNNNHVFEDDNSDESPTQQQQQQQQRGSPVKSRKSSLVHPRQPVISLSDVKITPDGNLAHQLECLADRAEAELRKLMILQGDKDLKAESDERPQAPSCISAAEKR